jgi:thiamine-phosphate diphosphorylase
LAAIGRALHPPVVMMVTDRARYRVSENDAAIERVVDDAVRAARAGADLIQIRERGLEACALLALAARIIDETRETGARTIVNDRLDVALAAGAHGVHLPARGMSSAAARAIVPDGFLIGRSVHSEAEAIAAQDDGGCDYLIFGSVFESASKPRGHAIAGADALARVCRRVPLPVLAIGGISRAHVGEVAAAGAAGVAAIGLFAAEGRDALDDVIREIRDAFGSR